MYVGFTVHEYYAISCCRCGRYCRRRRYFYCWWLRMMMKTSQKSFIKCCVVVLWWWCTGAGRHPIKLIKITIFFTAREREKTIFALCEISRDSHSPNSSANRNSQSQFIECSVAFYVLSHLIFSFNFQTIYSRIISAMHLWKYLFSIWVCRWNRNSPSNGERIKNKNGMKWQMDGIALNALVYNLVPAGRLRSIDQILMYSFKNRNRNINEITIEYLAMKRQVYVRHLNGRDNVAKSPAPQWHTIRELPTIFYFLFLFSSDISLRFLHGKKQSSYRVHNSSRLLFSYFSQQDTSEIMFGRCTIRAQLPRSSVLGRRHIF